MHMATGDDLVALAAKHIGEKYVLGVQVPKDNADWKGPWDCAEFASWCVFQVSQRLYGCTAGDASPPASADAFTGAWADDVRRLGDAISVERAARTPGAAVLRVPQPGAIGHVVISDGKGGTIEAMGSAFGVRRGSLDQRHWSTGVLVPWIDYTEAAAGIAPAPPPALLMLGDAGDDVRQLQLQLAAAGFSPGVVDGIFGPHTQAAVVAFQLQNGLVGDGEVGPQTRAALANAQPAVPAAGG
jgi:hypothetical protein